MVEELKPCPFCGERGGNYLDVAATPVTPTITRIQVMCYHCRARGPEVYDYTGHIKKTKEMARALWNDRYTEQPPSEA